MECDRDAVAAEAGAKEAVETVKSLITKERYKDASKCIKRAMKVYPTSDLLKEYGFGLLIISETLHYGDIHLSKCGHFDCYCVLHLPSSSNKGQVKKRFKELKNEVIKLNHNNTVIFPGAKLAECILELADVILHSQQSYDYGTQRKDSVLLDWQPRLVSKRTSSSSLSLRESYLDWKPPIYRVDATEHVQLWKKLKLDHLSPRLHHPKEEEAEEEEEEEEHPHDHQLQQEVEEDPDLSKELRILKRKVFDEMPQNPNYTPLEEYTKKLRQGMILGLELAFTKLCEEIRNLVDPQSFWYGLDGFNEQLSQLKKMGYNVEKVSERIGILKRIAEREQASRIAADKFEDDNKKREDDIRNREAEVINLRSQISELQAEIEKSKDVVANSKSKIETLKKDSSDAVTKFASTAKSNNSGEISSNG